MSEIEKNACMTVDDFLKSHRISRAKLYDLWNQGLGPRIMRVGSKVLITVEAAAAWRSEMEARTTTREAASAST